MIIQIRGVEEHLSYVEEELREIKKFEERFERYQAENFEDPAKLEEERERLRRLKKSVEARRHFLEELPGEYRKLEEQLERGLAKIVTEQKNYLEE